MNQLPNEGKLSLEDIRLLEHGERIYDSKKDFIPDDITLRIRKRPNADISFAFTMKPLCGDISTEKRIQW